MYGNETWSKIEHVHRYRLKNMKLLILEFLLFAFILLSCRSSPSKDTVKIIKEWRGKEIILPEKMEYKIMGRDTLCSDLWDKPYKILTYVDSVGCTSCQLGLSQWKTLMDSCNQNCMKVSFLFAVYSTNYKRFGYELIIDEFNHPIIYDRNNDFFKLNKFPKAPYRTFLLDQNNKVLLVGSPIGNPQMWALYKKVIMQSK